MPDWLIEGDSTVYLVLAVIEAVLIALWWRTRQKRYAIAAGVVAVVALILFALDKRYESDREQIARNLHEMAQAVKDGNVDRVFSHVSEEFRYGTVNKREFKQFCEKTHRSRHVTDMRIWDVDFGEKSREKRQADVMFRFKIRGNWSTGEESFICKATFRLDADGQWRLQTFQIFNPFVEKDTPMSIPGLGR